MDIYYNLKKDIEKIVGYKIEPFEMEEDDVISLLEDLVYEYESLKDELDYVVSDRDDNYRPIPISEQIGISDRDFM